MVPIVPIAVCGLEHLLHAALSVLFVVSGVLLFAAVLILIARAKLVKA